MRVTSVCKYFNCLPYSGGVMEQPGYVMLRLEKVIEANAEYEEKQTEKAEHFRKWRSEEQN